jgi:hypothetical protein
MSFDPEIIMAYVDGELDLVTAKRIEKAMESDPALASRVAAERALRSRLAARFDAILDEDVPERLTATLANVDTSFVGRQKRGHGHLGFGAAQWGAIAASLVLGLFAGKTYFPSTQGNIGERGGALIAQAGLRSALDTQLASSQPTNAATRIGITFRNRDGAICRTFDGQALSGIACRGGEDWRLVQTISGNGEKGDYRQAASGEIAEAASAMMAGDALDAEAERVALERNWK